MIVFILHWKSVHIYFTGRKLLLNSKQEKKVIGHHTRLRGNNDLHLWRAPAIKKKPPFFNVRALITREFMRSNDAQCNAKGRNDLNEPCEGLVMF